MENEKVYGRNIIRNSSAAAKSNRKAMMFLITILAGSILLGGILGACVTFGVMTERDAREKDINQATVLVTAKPFGLNDNRVFTAEMSMDWSNGEELGFVSLDVPLDKDIQEFVYCLSYGYNIDWTLTMAIIQHESGFNANAISDTNDYGLMQINEINHQWLSETLGVTDFLDAKQNVRSGLFILRKLFEKYGNDTHKVLMAYGLGETGANTFWEQGISSTVFSEEIVYIQSEFQDEINEKRGERNVN